MAGSSLKAALIVNFTIGVIKTLVGFLTLSAAMFAEALHSFADTFNQILLAIGIRRSQRKPDLEHPFGYQKVQFFWAFVVAVLIFGISGSIAFFEGVEIIRHPDEHKLNQEFFIWNLVVLGIAIVLESFALRTAYKETKEYQERFETETLSETIDEMQDPVLLSLLVEDSLALIGLVIAFIGTTLTFITHNAMIDGITSLIIGLVLMIGGLLLARENKTYLIGKAVSNQVQTEIRQVLDQHPGIKEVKKMRTMLLGPEDMILTLDIVFTDEVEENDVAEDIDSLEEKLSKIGHLRPGRIFIEAQ